MPALTPAELKQHATSKTTIYLKIEGPQTPIIEAIKKVEGVERIISANTENNLTILEIETDSTLDLRKKLVHFVINNSWELVEIYCQEKSLEDIFVKLTKQV